jgi:hypothetical protein
MEAWPVSEVGDERGTAARWSTRFRPIVVWLVVATASAGAGVGIRMAFTEAPATPSPAPTGSPPSPTGPVDVMGGYVEPGGQSVWTVALPADVKLPSFSPSTTCNDMHVALRKLGGTDTTETAVQLISRVRRPVKGLQLVSIRARIVRSLPVTTIESVQCFPKDWVVSYRDATFSLDAELNHGRSLVPPSYPIDLMGLGGALPNFSPGELNAATVSAGSYSDAAYEWDIVLRFRADGHSFTDVVRDGDRPFVVTGSERPALATERYVWCEGPHAHLERLQPGVPCRESRGPLPPLD